MTRATCWNMHCWYQGHVAQTPRYIMQFLRVEICATDAGRVAKDTGDGVVDFGVGNTSASGGCDKGEPAWHGSQSLAPLSLFEAMTANMVAIQAGPAAVACVSFSKQADLSHANGSPILLARCGAAAVVMSNDS